MDNKEEVKKPVDLGMDLADLGAKLEEEGEKVEAKAETMDELEGADKRIGIAMLAKIMPTLEKWEVGLLWQVLEDAKEDPEGMDITKLYESAMSKARAITKDYSMAASGEGETLYSLVMKKLMEMVAKARKDSIKKMAGALRASQGEIAFLRDVQNGLKERIAGYQEVQDKQSDSALMQEVKEMRLTTEVAKKQSESAIVALGGCEGDLLALKQQSGEDKKALEQVQKKLIRANNALKRYEEDVEQPTNVSAAALAQIKMLREEVSEQNGLLLSKMEVSKLESLKYVGEKIAEHEASMAGMMEHHTNVVMAEGGAQHRRVEGLLCSFAESLDRGLTVGAGRTAPLVEKEHGRVLEDERNLQYEEEMKERQEQKMINTVLRLEELHTNMHERRDLWMGFSMWAQITAMALMEDTLFGRLNGTEEGKRRMALVPEFSPRLLRDATGAIRRIEIDDMPGVTTALPVAATVPRMEGVQRGDGAAYAAQGTPTKYTSTTTPRQLDAKQLATAMKESKRAQKAYVSEDEDISDDEVGAWESDGDDEEDVEPPLARETVRSNVTNTTTTEASAKAMLDMSADDGVGNTEDSDDEEEEERVYDEEDSYHLTTEKDLPMNPRAILSICGQARVRERATFAKDLLLALHKAHQRQLQGKNAIGSNTQKIIDLWEGAKLTEFAYEKTKEMKGEMSAWKEFAGTKGKSEARRISMDANKSESDEYWGKHTNRYLAVASDMTLNQCLNVCRSKHVYEAMLLKNGRTTAWHREAKVIYDPDHVFNSRALLKFAQDTFRFPVGDLLYSDKSGCFTNEVLKTHRGMKAGDWNRRYWHSLGRKFDEDGNVIVEGTSSKARVVQKTPVPDEASEEEEGSEESDLAINSSDDEDKKAPTTLSEREAAKKKKKAEKKRRSAQRKRRETIVEKSLTAEVEALKLKMERDQEKAEKELADTKKESDRAYVKTIKDGQTKLPDLDGDMVKGYESGIVFRARATGSLYTDLQQIQHLETQAVVVRDGKNTPREPRSWRRANDMLEDVKKRVARGVRDEQKAFVKKKIPKKEYDFEVSGPAWAKKVMELFWVKWGETYVQPEETDEDNKIQAKVLKKEFDDVQFWYGNSPVDNLLELNRIQASGWACGLDITNREIKDKVLECNLPAIGTFNGVNLPPAIQPYFDYDGSDSDDEGEGLELTPVVMQKWYALGGLDGKTPLNVGKNKSLLLSYEMDPDKPCLPNATGMIKPVPRWKRKEKWGYSAEEMAPKARRAAGGKYAGDASERRVPEGDAAGGRMNAAGHFVPAWFLRMSPSKFEAFVPRIANAPELYQSVGQDVWEKFYRTFPGKGMCPITPAHNTVEARAMMKANGQESCPCISGVSLTNNRFGDDYTAQATEDELKKLHAKCVVIQQEKERRWLVEEHHMRDGIKKWANQERKRIKREAVQEWQAMKGAAALTSMAVETAATTAKGLTAVDEEEASYVEELEDEDDEESAGADLSCASVEQVGGSQGTCPSKGCLNLECGTCTLPRDVWDEEHHEYVHVEADPSPDVSSKKECDAINGVTTDVGESVEEMVAHSMAALHGLTGDETSGEAQWQTNCVDTAQVGGSGLSTSEEKKKEECKQEHLRLTAMERKVHDAQKLRDEEKRRKVQKLMAWMNSAREEQATGGKGKGGNGKGGKGNTAPGGKGKGGKGIKAPLPTATMRLATMYGGKGAPDFLAKDIVPTPPLPPKKPVAIEVPEVTPPSADTLDLGEVAFPALGMSMREKSNGGRKEVSGGSKAATTTRFMRKAYGYTASR